jgi:Ni2+-binding GTPase involved in maturation of urease and hydrogenase
MSNNKESLMNCIEITVTSTVGVGKSHVLATIEKALRETYGEQVVIESEELRVERNLLGDSSNWKCPAVSTTFILSEENLRE